MDVRTRVIACRLLKNMERNPLITKKLGLVDVSKCVAVNDRNTKKESAKESNMSKKACKTAGHC